MNKKALWITQTAAMTALLVVMQAVTAGFGNTLVTGSIVNLILILTTMLCGLSSGLTVAVISPVLAKLVGIGPLWGLIPFIALGNLVLVLLWHFLGNRTFAKPVVVYLVTLVAAAFAKFLTLYLTIVKIAVPLLLQLPEKQAAVISGMFSISQFVTACIGGAAALVLLPLLKKAMKARAA